MDLPLATASTCHNDEHEECEEDVNEVTGRK